MRKKLFFEMLHAGRALKKANWSSSMINAYLLGMKRVYVEHLDEFLRRKPVFIYSRKAQSYIPVFEGQVV